MNFIVENKDGKLLDIRTVEVLYDAELSTLDMPDSTIISGVTFNGCASQSGAMISNGDLVVQRKRKFNYSNYEIVNGEVNLYARFDENIYKVTFNYNSNKYTNVVKEYVAGTIFDKENYPFVDDGSRVIRTWSLNAFSYIEWDGIVDEDIILYPCWINYKNINLYYDENTKPEAIKVFEDEEEKKLNIPKKEGYIFNGWYTNSYFTTKVETIKKGSIGNLELVARWENGTSQYPYLISDANEFLMKIQQYGGSNAFFKLERDIDFAGKVFVRFAKFYGTLDGEGYSLQNIKIELTSCVGLIPTDANAYYIGLFQYVYGEIKNLNIKNAEVVVTNTKNKLRVGFLAGGVLNGTITNCTAHGKIQIVNGAIDNTVWAGGVIGYIENSQVSKCSASVTLDVTNSDIINCGGLIGRVCGSKIYESFSVGNVRAYGSNITDKNAYVDIG